MKYLSLKQPVAVFGRLVYPDAGILMLDDEAEAQRILDAGQATDVTAEFDALADSGVAQIASDEAKPAA